MFVALALSSWAGPIESRGPEYSRISSEVDPNLRDDESIYEFEFLGISDPTYTILYSVDGVNNEVKLSHGNRLTICVKPGKHIFQFFTWHFLEVFTDSLLIEGQHRDIYTVQLTAQMAEIQIQEREMKKPVIYLYPTEQTEVDLSVEIHGTNSFFYPAYQDGWKCTAFPNGDLQIDNKIYNYLFWEASMPKIELSYEEGFIVSKDEVVQFLEKQLTRAGLTPKEQADFITFWGPQLAQHDQTFVHFLFNENCDKFAELNISPKPDHVYRISMLWQPTEISFEVEEQVMEVINRDGFTVLEWGGMELSPITKNESL
ncbi:MAG: hypothetical protein ACI837_001169 [Crocinitomicaceae bacterium]|jgi:hypothetical protein